MIITKMQNVPGAPQRITLLHQLNPPLPNTPLLDELTQDKPSMHYDMQ